MTYWLACGELCWTFSLSIALSFRAGALATALAVPVPFDPRTIILLGNAAPLAWFSPGHTRLQAETVPHHNRYCTNCIIPRYVLQARDFKQAWKLLGTLLTQSTWAKVAANLHKHVLVGIVWLPLATLSLEVAPREGVASMVTSLRYAGVLHAL